jgi:hypothetical protein
MDYYIVSYKLGLFGVPRTSKFRDLERAKELLSLIYNIPVEKIKILKIKGVRDGK